MIFAFKKGEGIIVQPKMDITIDLLSKDELDISKHEDEILYYDIFMELPEFISEGLIKEYGTSNIVFPVERSKIDVIKYRKFLYRFLNPSEYELRIPKMNLQ